MSKAITYLITFIIFFAIFVGGIMLYKSGNYSKSSPKDDGANSKTAKLVALHTEFKWGGTFSPGFDWTQANIDKQMAILKENGINSIRFVYVPDSSPDNSLSDKVFASAKKYGINVILILEPEKTDYTNSSLNFRKIGADLASEAVSRFGNQVDYYQILNEVGGTALKSGDGQQASSYDPIKYTNVKNTLIGLETTIKQKDPTAKTIVSNQWLQYGILDMLIKDNVQFDIIGWNWFPAGIDMDSVQYAPGKTINMLAKLKSYHKEVWLTEFNRDHGSYGTNGQALQATFLQEKLQKYYDSGVFSGIFIHELFDKPGESSDKDRHWGLIGLNTVSQTLVPKQAFQVYSDFIKTHK